MALRPVEGCNISIISMTTIHSRPRHLMKAWALHSDGTGSTDHDSVSPARLNIFLQTHDSLLWPKAKRHAAACPVEVRGILPVINTVTEPATLLPTAIRFAPWSSSDVHRLTPCYVHFLVVCRDMLRVRLRADLDSSIATWCSSARACSLCSSRKAGLHPRTQGPTSIPSSHADLSAYSMVLPMYFCHPLAQQIICKQPRDILTRCGINSSVQQKPQEAWLSMVIMRITWLTQA